jgi:two-component system chemotaxis sensor kinase CheA
MLASMQRIASDRAIFLDCLTELRTRVQALAQDGGDGVVELRELHTLKGNAGILGLTSIARHCHELEGRLIEECRRLEPHERAALSQLWEALEQRLRPLLGETDGRIQLSLLEYNEALRAVANHEPYSQLASRMSAWVDEPTEKRLSLFADQARALAERLHKRELSVQVDDAGMRLPRQRLTEFWSTFVHVIRNAVDHGIESPDERRAAGKPENGLVTLSTKLEKSMVAVRVADDGRGIDWVRVSERAKANGLPHQTREDLEHALFCDGISTKEVATEISGRGVGLSAVRSVVTRMGGSIQIRSASGRGTELTFLFPLDTLRSAPGAAAPERKASIHAAG